MHIHPDMQILKLHGLISHLFGHFHLCIKWSFVCDVDVVQHGLRREMERAGFTLVIIGYYVRSWLGDLATRVSKAFVCLMCSFTSVPFTCCMLWRNPTVPLMCIPEQHSCQVHWGDTFFDAGVTQHLKSYRRCHVLAFSCVILVTLTPPLQSEMSVSLHLVPHVAWAYISL